MSSTNNPNPVAHAEPGARDVTAFPEAPKMGTQATPVVSQNVGSSFKVGDEVTISAKVVGIVDNSTLIMETTTNKRRISLLVADVKSASK